MFDENFGVNLNPEEKMIQYNMLCLIIDKMTLEEKRAFNAFITMKQMKELNGEHKIRK